MPNPTSAPPEGSVKLRGSGWEATVPWAVVALIVGALAGNRMGDGDRASDTKAEAERLANERFRVDVRNELESQRRARDLEVSELRNRLTAIEAGLAYWRKNGPQPAPP